MDDVVRINKKGYKVGEVSYELNLNKLKAPINKGEKVGTLIIKEDGKKVSIADVTVEENIEKANYFVLYLRYIKEILSGNYNF